MDIKVQIKVAWWWKPVIWTVYVLLVFRLVPLKIAERAVNAATQRAFRWRWGKKAWQRLTLDDAPIIRERQ